MSGRTPNQEHRVSVDNGRYTFVAPVRGWAISVLRNGDPWHQQTRALGAVHQLMSELDAARVVLAEVRSLTGSWRAGAQARLERALRHHDELVVDRSPPSPWAAEPPASTAELRDASISVSCSVCGGHARLTCQFETGDDERCGRLLCHSCTRRSATDHHLCPDHHQEIAGVRCPKCQYMSGDGWHQCEGNCPMPMSPHFRPELLELLAPLAIGDVGARPVVPTSPIVDATAPIAGAKEGGEPTDVHSARRGATLTPMTGRDLRVLLDDLERAHAEAFDREVVLRLGVTGESYFGGLRTIGVEEGDEESTIVLDGDDAATTYPKIPRGVPVSPPARLHSETLTVSLPDSELGASVDLHMYDHREPWMPEDYEAFAVSVSLDDSSHGLIYVQAINDRAGLLQLAERWESLAKALRERAGGDRPARASIGEETEGHATEGKTEDDPAVDRRHIERLAAAMGVVAGQRTYESLLGDVALNMRDTGLMLQMSEALVGIAGEVGLPVSINAPKGVSRAVRAAIVRMRREIERLARGATPGPPAPGTPRDHGDPLLRSVDSLDLSVRTSNCLARAEIKTLGELTRRTAEDVRCIQFSNARTVRDIAEALAEFGLSLSPSPTPPPSTRKRKGGHG